MSESPGTPIERWRALIGDAFVEAEVPAAATFPTRTRILGRIRPANTAEVQACVRVAHELRVPLHPVSRGKNWGYGSAVPPRDAYVLDLSRLDRIVDFDERLAYVTVEPGVTFGQLSSFLRGVRARVFASVTGGTAGGSVIANALERGDGAGPLGDRFGHVCGLEVVLADSSLVHTGFARFPGAAVAPLARWGVGPALDGMFSQSAFGIVTRATIWLAPYPRTFTMASWTADDLPAVVTALRGLKLAGVTQATVPIWNDIKALSLVMQCPDPPLTAERRATLRVANGFGHWNGTVSLYGASRAHADALRDLVRDALERVSQTTFHDGPDDPLTDDGGPALGVAHDRTAAATYWRKRTPPPADLDPDRDRCGFLWLSHAAPFDGTHARRVANLAEAALSRAGFEPNIALLGVTERALSCVIAIAYDRDVDGEDARALACHDALHAELVAAGYPPFRTGLQTPRPAGEPRYDALVDELARTLDPHGVFHG